MGLGEMWRCGCRGAGCRSPIVLAVVENLVGSWSHIVLALVQNLRLRRFEQLNCVPKQYAPT